MRYLVPHKFYSVVSPLLLKNKIYPTSMGISLKSIVYVSCREKLAAVLLRADKSWVEAERLTDSSCMQRWVASAGFTLLAFACLQLAWCSCQPVIDEYHHLKCKRKRLCEGRHDELPPAGALWDTLGAPPSSLSRFFFPLSLFLLRWPPCPSLCPFLLLCLFIFALFSTFYHFWALERLLRRLISCGVPPTFVLSCSSCPPLCLHDFQSRPAFIQLYLINSCPLLSKSLSLFLSSTPSTSLCLFAE